MYPGDTFCQHVRIGFICARDVLLAANWCILNASHSIFYFNSYAYCSLEMGIYWRYHFHCIRSWSEPVHLYTQFQYESLCLDESRYYYDDHFPFCCCRHSVHFVPLQEKEESSCSVIVRINLCQNSLFYSKI
jgi:hypothetical protein